LGKALLRASLGQSIVCFSVGVPALDFPPRRKGLGEEGFSGYGVLQLRPYCVYARKVPRGRRASAGAVSQFDAWGY
jgi:hypothetical protein